MTGATKWERSPLGGLRHRQVARLLALGELTQTAIAERYGVTQSAVSQFAARNAEEIRAIREDSANEFAGILIASKQERLGVYEQLLEAALTPTPKVTQTGRAVVDPVTGEPVMEINEGAASRVLKQVAEEMGQLPNRLSVQGEVSVQTRYEIVGLSPEALT